MIAVKTPPSSSKSTREKLSADIKLMMEWFAGYFDNCEQVSMEKANNIEPELIHEQIHSIFVPVKMPAFGNNILYVKQYMNGDPTQVYRQRIYSFHPHEKENAIELRIYAFFDDEAYLDAHLQPSKLLELTPEKMRFLPGCELYWQRNGNYFFGSTKEGACRVSSQRSGKTLIIEDDCYLEKEELWVRENAVDENGNYVFGHPDGIHHKLKRDRAVNWQQ